MANWQILVSAAALFLYAGSVVGFMTQRLKKERLLYVCFALDLVGVAGLLLASLWHGIKLTGRAERLVLIAFLAGLLGIVDLWRRVRHEKIKSLWVFLIPAACVALAGAASPSREGDAAVPLLTLCVVLAAGLGVWSVAWALNALLGGKRWEAPDIVFFGALTLCVMLVAGVNWRVWGTASGEVSATWGLWAAWLIAVTRRLLRHQSVWLTMSLDVLGGGLILVIATSVQWSLPFS